MDEFKNLLEDIDRDIEYIHFNTEDDCENFLI